MLIILACHLFGQLLSRPATGHPLLPCQAPASPDRCSLMELPAAVHDARHWRSHPAASMAMLCPGQTSQLQGNDTDPGPQFSPLHAKLQHSAAASHTYSVGAGGQVDPMDLEFSVLKNRLQERMQTDGVTDAEVKAWDLSQMTKVLL